MDPAVVGSSKFKFLWQHAHNTNERFYAKPLIYTPPGGRRLVFMASNQNIIRIYDAVTGALLKSRTLQPPFQASDTGCNDIPNTVGITGTPILDPGSHFVYFFSKGYHNGATGGGITAGWWHSDLFFLCC
jgi:iron transport multicopper oxidase